MSARRRVWFHRARAVAWAIVGTLSFPLGWANSVVLVWIASLYANISTDWGAAEAADDTDLRREIEQLRMSVDSQRAQLMRIEQAVAGDSHR